jgi:NAD(P)-dependent dehydrogenase (short-subunit alcohol dehydrogenase family)
MPAGTGGGRSVLVTGATSGIGLVTSRQLVAAGFRVLGGAFPTEDTAALREAGGTPVTLDVTDDASVRRARDQASEALAGAPLWGLVNNAGIVGAGPIEYVDLTELRRVFEVNVFGLVAVTQAFLPQLRESRGRIVNMSSLSALLAVPFLSPYNASKAAVEAISDSLRREVEHFGVEVVIVEPGVTRTPLWRHADAIDLGPFRSTPYAAALEKVHGTAVRKGGKGQPPENVARAIVQALTDPKPPTRIRVQRKLKAKIRYSLLPLLPDRLIDRLVADRVWR